MARARAGLAQSNEITAAPLLLDMLDARGATISIDAIGCQREIADKIVMSSSMTVKVCISQRMGLLRIDTVVQLPCPGSAVTYRLQNSRSQGIPFPGPGPPRLPSILTPGQFARKYIASSQEVICEQRVRPSQLNDLTGKAVGAAWGEATTGLEYGMRWPGDVGTLAGLSLA